MERNLELEKLNRKLDINALITLGAWISLPAAVLPTLFVQSNPELQFAQLVAAGLINIGSSLRATYLQKQVSELMSKIFYREKSEAIQNIERRIFETEKSRDLLTGIGNHSLVTFLPLVSTSLLPAPLLVAYAGTMVATSLRQFSFPKSLTNLEIAKENVLRKEAGLKKLAEVRKDGQ